MCIRDSCSEELRCSAVAQRWILKEQYKVHSNGICRNKDTCRHLQHNPLTGEIDSRNCAFLHKQDGALFCAYCAWLVKTINIPAFKQHRKRNLRALKLYESMKKTHAKDWEAECRRCEHSC